MKYIDEGHQIRAILFDLDGVLIDTNNWHPRAMNLALTVHFEEPMDEEETEVYLELNTAPMIEYLVSKGRVRQDKAEAMKKAKDFFVEKIMLQECKPCDRIKEVLSTVRDAGFKTGVVTNVSREMASLALYYAELDGFDVIITQDEIGDNGKPHPAPYSRANSSLGLVGKQSLAIDDSSRGIISAVDAMCRTWHLKRQSDLTAQNLLSVINSYVITI